MLVAPPKRAQIDPSQVGLTTITRPSLEIACGRVGVRGVRHWASRDRATGVVDVDTARLVVTGADELIDAQTQKVAPIGAGSA